MTASEAERELLRSAIEVLPIGESHVFRNRLSRAVVLGNDAGKAILMATLEGQTAQEIAEGVAEASEDVPGLTEAIEETRDAWQSAGLFSTEDLALHFPPAPAYSQEALTAIFALGERRVRLRADNPILFGQVATLMADYRVFDRSPSITTELRAVTLANGLAIFEQDRPLWRAARLDEARFLAIQAAVAALGGDNVCAVVHGGCVIKYGEALLIAGTTGRGKSTLTLALLDAGWSFAGDDMIPIDRAGRAIALPLGAHVKDTEALLQGGATRWAQWIEAPGGLQWPDRSAPAGHRAPVSAVLFPDFTRGAEREILPVTPEVALETLITTGTEVVGRSPSLEGVTRLLNQAPATKLVYGETAAALDLVDTISARRPR